MNKSTIALNKLGYYATDSLICGIKLVVALSQFAVAAYEVGTIAGQATIEAGHAARVHFNQFVESVYVQAMYAELHDKAKDINAWVNTQPGLVTVKTTTKNAVVKVTTTAQAWYTNIARNVYKYYRYTRYSYTATTLLVGRYQQQVREAVLAPAKYMAAKSLPHTPNVLE